MAAAFDFEVIKLGINPQHYDIILCNSIHKKECIDLLLSRDLFNKTFYYSDVEVKNKLINMYNNSAPEEFVIDRNFCMQREHQTIKNYIIGE